MFLREQKHEIEEFEHLEKLKEIKKKRDLVKDLYCMG